MRATSERLVTGSPSGVRAALTGRAWARDLRALLFLIRDLTARNLKIKYQRSALGFVWTLLDPLAMTLTLIAVFGGVVRLPVDSYRAFLLSGFFVVFRRFRGVIAEVL